MFINAPIVRTNIDQKTGKTHKGGDVRFSRIKKQIGNFLKQRQDIIVASFVDFYGIEEWPALDKIQTNHSPSDIARILNDGAKQEICQAYPERRPQERYFPFTAVHEFETLLFSDSSILADHLHIEREKVDKVLAECGSPEQINNSPETAPSKRLEKWNGQYGKTTDGIAIAAAIGIVRMREKCPLFDAWLCALERKAEEFYAAQS
ncbi:MAG: DUF4276 family protein [Lentisphaeria bacterium]|nr:DUF4276 family protein [Lentisphaeria bacterium]